MDGGDNSAFLLPAVDLRRAAAVLLLMLLGVVACVGLFILPSEQAMEFFARYRDHQVLGSLRGENSVHARSKLLQALLDMDPDISFDDPLENDMVLNMGRLDVQQAAKMIYRLIEA